MLDFNERHSIESPRSPLPWIILALWFIWLTIMFYMSWPEWGRARLSQTNVDESPARSKQEAPVT